MHFLLCVEADSVHSSSSSHNLQLLPISGVLEHTASASKANSDQSSMLNSSPLLSAFDGSLYTCMHHLEFVDKLVVGTGDGSLRFIDVPQAQKLHLWRSESAESSFQSLISCICSCGSDKMQIASPSWIAAGLSFGFCRLLNVRSGNIISSWRAHDGYVTKGLDVISIAKNKIGISSLLSRAAGYEVCVFAKWASDAHKLSNENFDPAAENFDYPVEMGLLMLTSYPTRTSILLLKILTILLKWLTDIRELISPEDVMKELGLGPNGCLMYCMEYLYNADFAVLLPPFLFLSYFSAIISW